MKINDLSQVLNQINKVEGLNQKGEKAGKKGGPEKAEGTGDFKDFFEAKLKEGEAMFANPAYDMNSMAVQAMMNEHGELKNDVADLVRGLMARQGITFEQLENGEIKELTVDELAQEKAKEMIGPGGPFSPENVSDRIVSFSIAVVGGDKGKIDLIRSSIDQGFKEAEKIMGELHDISHQTYDLIQEKLDAWINEDKVPEPGVEIPEAETPEEPAE